MTCNAVCSRALLLQRRYIGLDRTNLSTREIGRTSSEPQKRFDQIKKAVEQKVDVKAWSQTFAGDNPNEREFFEVFSWPWAA
jgi:hypothetical protein